MRKIVVKILKIAAWVLGSIATLLLLISILIQFPSVQNKLVTFGVDYLQQKIGTPVSLGRIEISFPKKIVLKDIVLLDQQNDTLVNAQYIGVDISLFGLLKSEVNVKQVALMGVGATIKVDSSGRSNYDYIVDAFASAQPEQEQDSSSMSISVADIKLQSIALKYQDNYQGSNLKLSIGEFSTHFKHFDLDQMKFDLASTALKNVNTHYVVSPSSADYLAHQALLKTQPQNQDAQQDSTSVLMPTLDLGVIKLENIVVNYIDELTKVDAKIDLNYFETDIPLVDMNTQKVDINSVVLQKLITQVSLGENKQTTSKVNQTQHEDTPEDSVGQVESELGWEVSLKEMLLESIALKYDDNNFAHLDFGLDTNHVDVNDLNVALQDFMFSQATVSGQLLDFSFKESSGLDLRKVKGYFLYSEQSSFLKDLVVQTANSTIKSSVVLNYTSLDALRSQVGQTSVDIQLNNSFIGLEDVDILLASFVKDRPVADLAHNKLDMELMAKGKIDDLVIDKLFLRGLETTHVSASAHLKGATEPLKGNYTIAIKDFQSSSKDLLTLGAGAFLSQNISLPALMSLKGDFQGGISDFKTNLALQTSLGDISVEATLDQKLKNNEQYTVLIGLDKVELGKVIGNDSIGAVSFKANVKGSSFKPELSKATVDLNLLQMSFNGHAYENLFLQGELDHGKYQLSSNYKDPSLKYDLVASGLWSENSLSLKLDSNFENVDFQGLNLVTDPLGFSTRLSIDMDNVLPDSLQGKVEILDLNVLANRQLVAFEPIVLSASATPGYREIKLNSQILDFDMRGDYKLTTLSQAITKSVSRYFDYNLVSESPDNATQQDTSKQYFDYSISIKNTPLIQNMVADLKAFEPIIIKGQYIEEQDFLSMQANIPKIQYADNVVEQVVLEVGTQQSALAYNLGIAKMYNASLGLRGLSLHGQIKDNSLIYNFDLRDSSDKLCYAIAGELKTHDKVLTHRMLPNGFMLDYVSWQVNENNLIALSKEGIYVNDFVLSLDNKTSIKMQSAEQTWQSPLTLNFENFMISSLTKMIKKDKLLADGMIDGFVTLTDLSKDLRFISNIDITDLEVLELALGNLHIGVKNESLSKYLAKVVLEGNNNHVELKGGVDFDSSKISMLLEVEKLQMGFFERFADQAISNTTGYFKGEVNIAGEFSQPTILGALDFVDIGMHVNTLNADFTKINERISFTAKGIEFDAFSITDSDGNLLVIDGQILTTSYKDFKFNIDIKAIDFKAMSSTAKDNDMYYGDLVFDSNIKIRGDLDKPIVTGAISVGKQTDFTVIMPQDDPSLADREGIVEFVDQQSLMLAQTQELQQTFNNSSIKGLDVSLAISVDKQAVFSLLMDKQSGDKVVMKGEADLVGGIDPSGKITLAGRYEFNEGTYDFSFNLIKRNFKIQKGSYIVFAGDPTDAQLKLTAIYEVKTAPLDLLQAQLSNLSPTQLNMYKQKIPFEALLKINGELLEPEISFDITLKDDITSVSGDVISNTNTKLAQLRQNETEMNKQVFALLLLNHFIGENPFESSNGGVTAGSIARQSVNKILSDQLNNLADNLIQGVELNFNLESSDDFSTGNRQTRTDLNVAVSKRLFADRLKVSVGSNFEVEGAQRENEQAANIAGDIELEYALTQDGRYLVRVYRKNRYEVALQAQVVETGVGFVITMSYEHFRELFEKSKNKRELKKQLRNESEK